MNAIINVVCYKSKTLYWSEKDSIPGVTEINYEVRDVDGISAKGGTSPEIPIFYSSRWVEKCEKDGLWDEYQQYIQSASAKK